MHKTASTHMVWLEAAVTVTCSGAPYTVVTVLDHNQCVMATFFILALIVTFNIHSATCDRGRKSLTVTDDVTSQELDQEDERPKDFGMCWNYIPYRWQFHEYLVTNCQAHLSRITDLNYGCTARSFVMIYSACQYLIELFRCIVQI